MAAAGASAETENPTVKLNPIHPMAPRNLEIQAVAGANDPENPQNPGRQAGRPRTAGRQAGTCGRTAERYPENGRTVSGRCISRK